MADLFIRVKAEYDSAIKCREALKKVDEQLKALDENSSPKEIERLTKEYARLSASWENSISRIGKFGYYAKDAFSSIKDMIGSTNKELSKTDDANKSLYSSLSNRLQLEQRIAEQLAKQREVAEKQYANAIEGYNRNATTYQRIQSYLDKKYNSQAEGFWSKEDQQRMEEGRETLRNWEREIEDRRVQLNTFSDLLSASQKNIDDYKNKIGNLELPRVDLKSNIDDLEQQIDSGTKKVDDMKESLASMKEELAKHDVQDNGFSQYFQEVKDGMYALSDEITKKKGEIDELKGVIDNFDITSLISQQQSLTAYADELTAKIQDEETAIESLKERQKGLNEESVIYKSLQDEIDSRVESKEMAQEALERTEDSLRKNNELIAEETKLQEERQQKVKDLSVEVDELTGKYEHQKEVLADTEASNKAVEDLKVKIKETEEEIERTTASTEALKDILTQVSEAYEKTSVNDSTYTGFASYDNDGARAHRVFKQEDDYNRYKSLASEESSLQQQITSGVENGSLSLQELEELQAKLQEVQSEMGELEAKAMSTAEALGDNLAGKAQSATERLYELNSAIEEETKKYNDLEMQLQNLQQLLEAQESNGTPEQIAATKREIDELKASLAETGEKLSVLRAEQHDAQSEVSGLAGMFDMLESNVVKAVGGMENFNKILSIMPAGIRGVVTGLISMKSAAMAFLATPVGITIMAIAAALYGVKKALETVFLWFNKTAEGQKAYAKIAGYLRGIMTRLEEIFIKLGGTIFNVSKKVVGYITQPKKAFKDLIDFIGSQIKNRLKGFIDVFVGFGESIAGVFVDLWESIKSGKLDFSETKKSAKKVLDGILAISTGVENITDKIGNAANATVDWFKRTKDVAEETSRLAYEERMLGIEQEKNKKKQLELQKSMLENMAIMRNTNASKEERKKALEEYKKQLEDQAKIQKDFAEKRLSLQQRRMAVAPNTIEDYQEEMRRQNDVLSADVSKQRSITALSRVTNSIEKKSGGSGKTKEQRLAEYNLLLDEQAQKQAKQIRENGYIIEQARINAMEESTERTLAQMKLDYKKELDAAIEYENDLKREKIKLARDRFQKDTKNKGKVFDPTTVDVSMTEQEQNVKQAKIDNANNRYQKQVENLYKQFETFDEQRERKERDYYSLLELNANLVTEKIKEQANLISQMEGLSEEEAKPIKERIDLLDREIDLLQRKARLIEANFKLNNEEAKSMNEYLKSSNSFMEQRLAIESEYAARIKEQEARGNKWQVEILKEQKKAALSSVDAKALRESIDWTMLFDGFSSAFQGQIKATLDNVEAYMKTKDFAKLDAVNKAEFVKLRNELSGKTGGSVGTFNFSIYNKIGKQMESYFSLLKDVNDAEQKHHEATSELIEAQQKLTEAETKAASQTATQADKDAAENAQKEFNAKKGVYDTTKANYESQQSKANIAKSNLQKSVTDAKKSIDNFGKALDQMTNGTLRGFADGLINLYNAISGNGLTNGIEGIGSIFKKTKKTIDTVDKKTGDINKSIDKAGNNIKESSNIVNGVTEGVNTDIQKVGQETKNATSQMGSVVSGIAALAGESGNIYGMIIGAVLDLLDILGRNDAGIAGFVDELLQKIINIIDVIFEQLFTGKIFEAVFSNIAELIGTMVRDVFEKFLGNIFNGKFWYQGIFQGIFGSFFKGLAEPFGLGSKDTREDTDKAIAYSNKILESIDKNVNTITEKMEKSYGTKAIEQYEELLKQYEAKNNEYAWQVYQAGNTYYDQGHREWYYRNVNGGWDENGYVQRIRRFLGIDTNREISWENLFFQLGEMGTEGAKKLAELRKAAEEGNAEAKDLWNQINYTGWDDEGRISQAANSWADLAEQMKEAEEAFKEVLLTTSFDNVFDDFMNNLYDYANGANDVFENIAENWQKMVNKMLINNLVGQKMQDELSKAYDTWYTKVRKANENNDKKALKEANDEFYGSYKSIFQEGVDQIKELKNMGIGIRSTKNEQRSAEANSIKNISYEQADSLIGIELAKQMILEQMLRIMRGLGGEVYYEGGDAYSAQTYTEVRMIRENLEYAVQDIRAINTDGMKTMNDFLAHIVTILDTRELSGNSVMAELVTQILRMKNGQDDYIAKLFDNKFSDLFKKYGVGTLEDLLKKADYDWRIYNDLRDRGVDPNMSAEEIMAAIAQQGQKEYSTLFGADNDWKDQLAEVLMVANEQDNANTTFLTIKAEQLSVLATEHRDIAADSRDILAGMAIHVEEIRDGVVDTIVPRIKNIDDNLENVYRIVREA